MKIKKEGTSMLMKDHGGNHYTMINNPTKGSINPKDCEMGDRPIKSFTIDFECHVDK